jgi:hypothetical protein
MPSPSPKRRNEAVGQNNIGEHGVLRDVSGEGDALFVLEKEASSVKQTGPVSEGLE